MKLQVPDASQRGDADGEVRTLSPPFIGLEKRVHETQFAFVFLWVVAGATG